MKTILSICAVFLMSATANGQCANGQCSPGGFGARFFAPQQSGGSCVSGSCGAASFTPAAPVAHGWYQGDGTKLVLFWRGEQIGTLDAASNVWQTAGKSSTVDLVKTFAVAKATCEGVACAGPASCAANGKCAECDKCTAKVAKSLPASVDPKALREVTIPQGYSLYQDKSGNLYVLDREAVKLATSLTPAYSWLLVGGK